VPAPKAYRIDDRVCVDCSACVPVCPVDAIVPAVPADKMAEAWARSVLSEAAE
jgi:formate hydrogenlyase subunit 6/NADH:ubiquinone oxidoreductase subunit I